MGETAQRAFVYVCVVVLLLAGLSLAGCRRVGTAGVPPTAEESPITTTSTPPTVVAATRQQQRLERARDVLQAQQTGIKLFVSTPLAEDYVNQSQLIVHGRVTELHPVWPAESAPSNGYLGIWVEPVEVLKGSPRSAGPVVFALLALSAGDYQSPLSYGDEVLCFSYRGVEELSTRTEATGADFFWNDSYGVFLRVEDKFVSVLSPSAFTTIDEVRALVGPKDTSTTLPPGYLPFEGRAWTFEDRVTRTQLPGTLPYEILASADLDWLPLAIDPLEMTMAKGYRFSNGDLVFLWETPWPGASFEEREPAIVRGLEAAAKERYGVTDEQVWAFWFGEFGYLVVSNDYVDALGSVAQMAQTGQPPD